MCRKLLLLLSFSLICPILKAQNLVPNPSFEIHNGCPNMRDNFHGTYLPGWYGIGQYYHACGTKFSTPVNIDGYQKPADGEAYVGIVTYDAFDSLFQQNTRRPFTAAKLSKPLTKGNLYRLSMKVSAIDNRGSGHPPSTEVFYSNNIGIRLFKDFRLGGDYFVPDNIAHTYAKEIIMDTMNWTEISGTLRADSNYEFIVIANFFDNAHTKIKRPLSGDHVFVAWYYIDAVEVREIPEIGISDTVVCKGTEVEVQTRYSGNFYWHYADAPQDTISKEGRFTIKPTKDCVLVFHSLEDDYTDTFKIRVFPPPLIKFPSEMILCEDSMLVLDAFSPGAFYSWSTGDTTASIMVAKAGIYSVQASVGSCIAEGSVTVTVCEPEVFIPTAFSPDDNYINDVFQPVMSRIRSYQLQVYNRWGQQLFTGSSGWNGSDAPEGSYIWIFRGQAYSGEVIWKKGSVFLVR